MRRRALWWAGAAVLTLIAAVVFVPGIVRRLRPPPPMATVLWSTPVTAQAVGYGGVCAAVDDLDGDGLGDVAVSAWNEFDAQGGFIDLLSGRDGRQIARIEPQWPSKGFGKSLMPCPGGEPFLFTISDSLVFGVTRDGDSVGCAELQTHPTYEDWRGAAAVVDDVDGDGRQDFVLGMLDGHVNAPKGSAMLLGTAPGHEAWRITGDQDSDRLGSGVVPIHDVDDDGVGDVVLQGARVCTVVSVRSGKRLATWRGDWNFGSCVLVCDDLTGDEVPDLCVADPSAPATGGRFGGVRVIDGRSLEEVRRIDGGGLFDHFGSPILDVGDVDGDEATDLAVVSYGDDYYHRLHLVSGATGRLLGSRAVCPIGDLLSSATVVDDVDGDGLRDVLIGVAGGLERGGGPWAMPGYVVLVSTVSLLQP